MPSDQTLTSEGISRALPIDERYVNVKEVFRFRSPEITYGRGASERIVDLLDDDARAKPFVVTDRNLREAGVGNSAIEGLRSAGEPAVFERAPGEPTASEIDEIAAAARDAQCTAIVAIGGGATMDASKCVRVVLELGGSIRDHAGEPKLGSREAIPLVAVPTTSGTGSESGVGALYIDDEKREKVPVFAEGMLPNFAVCDPDLTFSVPAGATAAIGADALAQAIGPFTGPLRHPITDALSSTAIALILRHLATAVADGGDVEARVALAHASLMSGLAMNNSEAMADQFFDEVIGPRYSVAHGNVAGVLLPYVVQFNRGAAEERTALLARMALDPSGDGRTPSADDLVNALQELRHRISLPGLEEMGVPEDDLAELAHLTAGHYAVEMGINPRELSENAAFAILDAAWHERPPLDLQI